MGGDLYTVAKKKAAKKAKKKKLEKKTLADYGVEDAGKARLKTVKVEEPPPRKGGGKVEDVDGLIAKLKELGAI